MEAQIHPNKNGARLSVIPKQKGKQREAYLLIYQVPEHPDINMTLIQTRFRGKKEGSADCSKQMLVNRCC